MTADLAYVASVIALSAAIALLYRRLGRLEQRLVEAAEDQHRRRDDGATAAVAEPTFAFDFDREGRAVSVYTDHDGIDLRGMSPAERARIGLIIVNSNQGAGV
jgi:hypothetical protein